MVLPEKFKEYLQEAIGTEKAGIVISAIISGEPELSVRVNPRKWTRNGVVDAHLAKLISGNSVPWCKDGLYLSERPVFTLDPSIHAGAYYVQEPSSMILALLKPFLQELSCYESAQQLAPVAGISSSSITGTPSVPITLLDLCAAPGGKSTHLASIMPKGSKLTANEVIRTRVGTLRENIVKWGNPDVEVTSLDASEFSRRGYSFDFILVDAPCSGEGMFRKDPSAIKEWSAEAVKLSASRQKRILSDIWGSLSPGGLLAYSTCTMNRYENEDNVAWLIEKFGALPVDLVGDNVTAVFSKADAQKAGILFSDNFTLRLHPGLVKGEGLFFALLQKPGEEGDVSQSFDRNKNALDQKYLQIDNYKKSSKHIIHSEKVSESISKKKQRSFETSFVTKNSKLPPLPEIPDHNNALSLDYAGECPSVELSKEDALTYLSRGTIKLEDQPLGYLRVTYGGLGLGFVKNLGSRTNNLLPMNLRIRMQI